MLSKVSQGIYDLLNTDIYLRLDGIMLVLNYFNCYSVTFIFSEKYYAKDDSNTSLGTLIILDNKLQSFGEDTSRSLL